MKIIITILSLIILTACAPLSHHDSWLGDTGEVVGRTLLCPVTLCISEYEFYSRWQQRQEQNRYNAWYQSLSPEQQEREDQRRHERGLAAAQSLGMMNMGRGPMLQYTPPKRVHVPNQAPMPAYNPPVQRNPNVNCTSIVNGQQIYTNCQ